MSTFFLLLPMVFSIFFSAKLLDLYYFRYLRQRKIFIFVYWAFPVATSLMYWVPMILEDDVTALYVFFLALVGVVCAFHYFRRSEQRTIFTLMYSLSPVVVGALYSLLVLTSHIYERGEIATFFVLSALPPLIFISQVIFFIAYSMAKKASKTRFDTMLRAIIYGFLIPFFVLMLFFIGR